MIKVLLIETPCSKIDNDKLDPPTGLLSLATILKKNGYFATVLDLSSLDEKEWLSHIPEGFDVLGFRTVCVSFNDTLKIKQLALQKNSGGVTIAGGPHASALPELHANYFNYVVIGEGELVLLDIVAAIAVGENQKLPKVITGKPLENNYIHFPDYSLINLSEYSRNVIGKKTLALLTSRGCGYSCAYCNSSVFGSNTIFRAMNESVLAGEMRKIKQNTGIDIYKFIDDNLLGPKNPLDRAKKLCLALKPLDIEFRCYLRVDQISMDVLFYLKECGCAHITFGIESGDADVLRSMRRGYTPEDIVRGVNLAAEQGFGVQINLMVGFPPFESDKTIKNTCSIISELKFDKFFVYPFIPYPGCDVELYPDAYNITDINKNYSQYLQVGKNRKSEYLFTTSSYGPENINKWKNILMTKLVEKAVWFGDK